MTKFIYVTLLILSTIISVTSCNSKTDNNCSCSEKETVCQGDCENCKNDSCINSAKKVVEKNDILADLKGKPAVIDFSADWCSWCKKLEPTIEMLEKKYDGEVEFETIDTDKYKALAIQYKIQGLPTLVFLDKDGNEVTRIEGYTDQATIETAIGKIIER